METLSLQNLVHDRGLSASSAGVPEQAIDGVLTRTLFRSPVTKLILPARIRHQDLNDVIFVRVNAIEIKTYRDGYLHHVAIKDDFGATIRAARVIGQPRSPVGKVELPSLEQILKQTKFENLPSDPMDIDHVFRSPQLPKLPSPPPPQLLALTLQSSREDTLVFLSASQHSTDDTRFVSSHVPLTTTRSGDRGRLGKYIAVDPRSRAMAVAASYGSFVVYALKSMSQLQDEVKSSDGSYAAGFKPIKEERHMLIDGWILKMEFLYPAKKDINHVILLIVARTDRKTRFSRYEWDWSKDLRDLKQTDTRLARPMEQCPLLLIPFSINTGFILIMEKTMSIYAHILKPHVKPINNPMGPASEPGSSKKDPLWTTWARPSRRSDYAEQHDDFYICKEDGAIYFVAINTTGLNWGMTVTHTVGQLLVNINTAFAVLDNEWDCAESSDRGESNGIGSSYDILAATGDMSSGKIALMEARIDPDVRQTIPNWTPMLDFCAVPPKSTNSLGRGHAGMNEQERIFGCMGRGPHHGAVGELRLGIEAESRIKFSLPVHTVTGMWILPDISGLANGICMLVSDIDDSTHLLRVSTHEVEDLAEPEDLFGIDLEYKTVTAGSTASGIVIQITVRSIQAFMPGQMVPYVHHFDGRVRSAYIDGHHAAVLLAVERDREIALFYGQYPVIDGQLSPSGFSKNHARLLPDTEPSCLFLHEISGHMYAFVGTVDSRLTVFDVSCAQGLLQRLQWTFGGDFAVCESMVMLWRKVSVETDDQFLLLCGLRNGSLQSLSFRTDHPRQMSLTNCGVTTFGTTRVTVLPDRSSSEAPWYTSHGAIVSCGQTLVYMTYNSNQQGSDTAQIRSIYLTETASELSQPPVSVISQSDPWNSNHGPCSRYLFCADSALVHGAELGTSREPFPVIRRMPIAGTPNKIIFSKELQKLVVSYTTLRTRTPRQINEMKPKNPKRCVFPTLVFLDPDQQAHETDENTVNLPQDVTLTRGQMLPEYIPRIIGDSGMKVLGLTQWTPKLLGNTYLFLAVNTLEKGSDRGPDTGTIYLYNVLRDNQGQIGLDKKKSIHCSDPVDSVATFNTNSLVFTSGLQVALRTIAIVNGETKILEPVVYSLRSRGLSVSVREPFVYISSAKHSLMVFRFEANEFIPVFSDSEAREGLSHISLLPSEVVLASNRPGPNHPTPKVIGLSHISTPRIDNATRTLFEIVTPGSVRKFSQANIRAPWNVRAPSFTKRNSADTVVGGCTDGSVYSFEFLDEPEWRLLRFIQNLCERNTVVCPSAIYLRQHRRRIEPSALVQDKHIDGDILLRLLERGTPNTASFLRTMMREIAVSHTHHSDFEFQTPEQCLERFREIVVAVFGECDDPLDAVSVYLKQLLRPIL